MKEQFHGYFKPSKAEYNKLWDDSIFAFDANILLNLYRYSETTRNELLKVISLLNDRIWLPYQAAEEYFRNRISTTGGQAKEYDKVQNTLNELLSNLGNKNRHPFIADALFKDLEETFEKIKAEFEINKKILNNRIYSDEIQNKLAELFENRIGKAFGQHELDDIYKEGKMRYEAEIPPGFRDGNKDNSGNPHRKFGDLIIYNELISKAKSEKKSIIFVTDDKKDDWWLEYSGKTISPLPSLVHEFKEKTSQSFYMYTADRFMQAATEFSTEKVEEDVIIELKEFRQNEEVLKDFIRVLNQTHLTPIYKITSEEEILNHLIEYSKLRLADEDSFIGLKHFVTTYLAEKGIEINQAYTTINALNEKTIIELYDKPIGNFHVKAVRLK
ncbi:PIN-like domain-containing protein [Aquirufa ecclesiirivi]|uniref:PIN-like domain-containing protein n=1 Tax=Aquirufa ecclesiirivi TaxID=2715124 RepID=UPI003BB170C4